MHADTSTRTRSGRLTQWLVSGPPFVFLCIFFLVPAAIMVVVFGSFMLEFERTMKMMGTGLAVAILFDATIVRMLLVPATMELLGDRNWWLPGWLDRLLPNVDVEGHAEDAAPLDKPDERQPELVGTD